MQHLIKPPSVRQVMSYVLFEQLMAMFMSQHVDSSLSSADWVAYLNVEGVMHLVVCMRVSMSVAELADYRTHQPGTFCAHL